MCVFIECDLTIPTDIVVVMDQRCADNPWVNMTCQERRPLVYTIFDSIFKKDLTNVALLTLECMNPMKYIDFTSNANNDKQSLLNFVNSDSQFPICMSRDNGWTENCDPTCGVGMDTAIDCFENNDSSSNRRKVIVFLSFCDCVGEDDESICARKSELEEQGIEVIVANFDKGSDDAACVDRDENPVWSQNFISQFNTKKIIDRICNETGFTLTTAVPTTTTTTTVTTTTTQGPTPTPSVIPTTIPTLPTPAPVVFGNMFLFFCFDFWLCVCMFFYVCITWLNFVLCVVFFAFFGLGLDRLWIDKSGRYSCSD